MPLPTGRHYTNWVLTPPCDPDKGVQDWSDPASVGLLRELLRRHSEIASYGRKYFSGTLAQKNASWRVYRNFLRQAISNYDAALGVPNRSACLLYYYALLNFSKAELLDTHSSQLVGRYIGHGLRFSTHKAKTIAGDELVVTDGVFRMLYERRMGMPIAKGERLPIKKLLSNIPEIASQLQDADLGNSATVPLLQMIASDSTCSWPVLLLPSTGPVDRTSTTGKLFHEVFHEVASVPHWRDHFSISRRLAAETHMYESHQQVPRPAPELVDNAVLGITWKLHQVLSPCDNGMYDAWLTPSLLKSRFLPMPSSLARYAIMYYASSLVRYRPSMLDPQLFPEQGYLLDAIARECAMPMLIDTLSALERRVQYFYPADSLRT